MRSVSRLAACSWFVAVLAGCGAPAACGPDTLNVSRTLRLEDGTVAPEQLLEPGEVILTFDDGPKPWRTRAVLKELDRQCTKATFFLVGKPANANPGLAAHIVEKGHTVGSHSMDHANLAGMDLAAALDNALAGQSAVEAAAGRPATLFRFPFVATTPELTDAIRGAGLIDVGVTADGEDWTGTSPEAASDRILEMLEAAGRKGIVLLHDPMPRSAARTRVLLQRLKDDGYQVVALEGPDA